MGHSGEENDCPETGVGKFSVNATVLLFRNHSKASVYSEPAWSTWQVLGWQKLHREFTSKKKKKVEYGGKHW